MLEMLSAVTPRIPAVTLFEVNFADYSVGATAVVDKASGLTLTATAANVGSVVDDPTMGKCFSFNGTGGFRFSDSRSLAVVDKKIRIVVEFRPADVQNRALLYTGSYDRVRIPGWNIFANAGNGDSLWLDQGSAYDYATLTNKGIQQRTIEGRMGIGYGMSLRSGAEVKTATPMAPVNGGIFFLGTCDTRSGRIGYSGLIKSVKIESVPG